MSNVIRDARGMSDLELYLRDAVSQGKKMVPIEPVIQLLEDITTMRREVYVDKALDCTNAAKRQEIDDMNWFIDLQRKLAFKD